MGRPKLLNREHVIDVAMSQYWQRGIDNVGMAEIARLSGFDRAGIYKEFGSEEGLAHEVINTYLDRNWFPRIPILDSVSSPAMSIKMIFDAFANDNVMKNLTQYGVQDKAVKWPKPVTKARGCCFYGLLGARVGYRVYGYRRYVSIVQSCSICCRKLIAYGIKVIFNFKVRNSVTISNVRPYRAKNFYRYGEFKTTVLHCLLCVASSVRRLTTV